MTDTPQPTSGSLSATIIRACTKHKNCPLDCPRRKVENLGEVAAFSTPAPEPPSSPSLRARFTTWLKGV